MKEGHWRLRVGLWDPAWESGYDSFNCPASVGCRRVGDLLRDYEKLAKVMEVVSIPGY